jgi:hypothetical protein
VEIMANVLRRHLGAPVTLNDPFLGGYITQARPGGLPWLQLELSRAPFATFEAKTRAVLAALEELCATNGWL